MRDWETGTELSDQFARKYIAALEVPNTQPTHLVHRLKSQNALLYRAEKKSWYVVARNVFLLLLNLSAWPCLGAS